MKSEAKWYAIKCHRETNHRYNEHPYEFHLQMVVDNCFKFKHLIPIGYYEIVENACWCHDVIEDCRQTYNDVKNNTNQMTAEIVYALTNEKGKCRKERANEKYYQGIKETRFAVFVKICDRIANYRYSLLTRSKMAEMYEKEMDYFCSIIYDRSYDEMFDYLKNLPKTIENERSN